MMKLLLLFVLLRCSLSGQPTISSIVVDDITGYGARIHWVASTASAGSRIQWGTVSGSLVNSSYLLSDITGLTHGWFLSGLTPATTYYFRPCSTAGTEGCSASEQSFTTAAAEPGNVTYPTLPSAAETLTMPTTFASTETVNAACTDLQTKLDLIASRDGAQNHRVLLPVGVVCGGRFTLPAKSGDNSSGTGTLVLTSAATIPPAGARVEPSMVAGWGRIIGNLVTVTSAATSQPGCSDVGDTWIDADSTNPNAFYFWCTSTTGPVWTAVSMPSGTTVPATCSVGAFFYKSDTVDPKMRLWYCFETDRYLNWYTDDSGSNIVNHAALVTAANASRWLLAGFHMQRPKLPASYTNLLPLTTGNGEQVSSISRCFAYTVNSASRITFDRVLFDAIGFPYRFQDAFCFARGTHLSIVNNYFNETNRWRPSSGLEFTPNTINITESGGPIRIENNYFRNAHGITIFHPDDVAGGMMTNATIRRNHFYEDPSRNALSVSYSGAGQVYYRRHMLECKRCQYWLVEGNTFEGGWPVGNQGATVALTPRSVTSGENVGVRDFTFRYNRMLWCPQCFLITGHDDYADNNTLATNRIAIQHNLIYMTGRSSDGSTQGWPVNQMVGHVMEIGLGIQNLSIKNNSFLGVNNLSGSSPAHMISHGGAWMPYKNSRLELENNIYTQLAATTGGWWGLYGYCSSELHSGTAALDCAWPGSWVARGNAWQATRNGVFSDGATYPSGNYRTEDHTVFTGSLYAALGGNDPGGVRVRGGSPFSAGSATARGYDGRDAGVDFVSLDEAQGDIYNLRVLNIGASTATVAYRAPDAASACTVEYGTTDVPGDGLRVVDTPGGSRWRSVALSDLEAGRTYVRVYCARMAVVSFMTRGAP